jgi:hypothetical protein
MKPGPNIGDITVKGSTSNQVTVQRPAGQNPAPNDVLPVGPVEIRKTLRGETVVKAGGLEMSLAEAHSLGLVRASTTVDLQEDGGMTIVGEKVETVEPKAGAGNDAGDTGGPSEAEVVSHALELNAVGAALDGAGIDAEGALSRAVVSAGETGDLPEDISEALINRFGPDDAQLLIDNAQNYVATVTENAIKAAGLNINDPATVAGLNAALAGNSAIFVDAIRGRPQALNNAIFAFAAKRR